MSRDFGYSSKVNAMSVSLATDDVGDIIGLGIVFDSSIAAADFVEHVRRYFEGRRTAYRVFKVEFKDRDNNCDVTVRVGDETSSMVVEVVKSSRQVMVDISTALRQQPYIFVMPYFHSPDGLQPYAPDEVFITLGSVAVDGLAIEGNQNGQWPRGGNPFRS